MGKVLPYVPAGASLLFGIGLQVSGVEIPWLGYTLMVRTIIPDEGELYNKFIHFDARRHEVIGVDDDADGVLDRITNGIADLEASQELYRTVLKEGVRLGRIQATDGRYIVEPK